MADKVRHNQHLKLRLSLLPDYEPNKKSANSLKQWKSGDSDDKRNTV
ncbi:hypothetical protein SAMN05421771_0132 [Granulicella pectinivorans]|uniref:Uncharacterized protein n=1 Tax=Granulicella pectinivorans TaxID=474950 RepID=A0A1I6L1X4_9BACT|nr:hypothetical protein SAMN05421771_0132 [Granulicella pectinivorans]